MKQPGWQTRKKKQSCERAEHFIQQPAHQPMNLDGSKSSTLDLSPVSLSAQWGRPCPFSEPPFPVFEARTGLSQKNPRPGSGPRVSVGIDRAPQISSE